MKKRQNNGAGSRGLIEKVRFEQTLEEREELAEWTERKPCSRRKKQLEQKSGGRTRAVPVRSTRGHWDWESKHGETGGEEAERKKSFQPGGTSAPKAREAGHPLMTG